MSANKTIKIHMVYLSKHNITVLHGDNNYYPYSHNMTFTFEYSFRKN